ncbi:MAG: universal stress protein [Chloroflexota bacterium]|nr:universal stress protein [Chloroflexota bacterium]
MFRHILVPLDGSHLAATALPYALTLARASDARISLLAVVASPPAHAGLPSTAAQESDERHVTESTAYLESVAIAMRADGFAVTTVVRHGNPASEILAASEDEECSLIVISTHGRTGLERLHMGSVAQHVLRHAIIPTLVVRPGDDTATVGAATIAAITVTLDGSSLAEEALPIATRIATALSIPLTLLRIIPSLASLASTGWGAGYAAYYPMTEEMEADEEHAVEMYLDALATRLRASGLEVGTCWERGVTVRAEEMIAAVLAKQPAGIAIMASHGRGGVLRWALGSTAEEVLDHTPSPILIVRAGTTAAGSEDTMPSSVGVLGSHGGGGTLQHR